MYMKHEFELHIIIDETGVQKVQIIGPSEAHPSGHDLYFKIRDLVSGLDEEIRKKLKQKEDEEKDYDKYV